MGRDSRGIVACCGMLMAFLPALGGLVPNALGQPITYSCGEFEAQCHHLAGCYEPPNPVVPGPGAVSDDCEETCSSCWFYGFSHGEWPWPQTGFALNVDLWQAVAPIDCPPVSLDPYEGTSPLVSGEMRHSMGPVPYRARETLNGTVDLMTGAPLLREVDFELPFGGAMFRHVRTYSENISVQRLRARGGRLLPNWRGTFWDWNGMFWMMGENPLFLIDLEYHDTSHLVPDPSDPTGEGQMHVDYTDGDSCRCYFIPDAHHAIPFIYADEGLTHSVTGERIPGTGRYEAPSWFDAVMMPGPSVDDQPPQYFHVWLNRKSIKYTITPYYEDVWDENGISMHLPSQPDGTGGLGMPYYGLVTQIEDRYGNRVEIEYCEDRHFGWDEYGCTRDEGGDFTPDCLECGQSCTEKGQIRTVKLYPASQESEADPTAAWTLVYTHRAFNYPGLAPVFPEGEDAAPFGQHALHSIHVYRGDVTPTSDCLTLSASQFCEATSIAEMEAIDHPDIATLGNWSIEVKYTYGMKYEFGEGVPEGDPDIPEGYEESQVQCLSAELYGAAGPDWHADNPQPDNELNYRLLKTKVTRRDPEDTREPGDSQLTMYRYGTAVGDGDLPTNRSRYLKAIYDNDTINAILAAQGEDAEPDSLFSVADCQPVSHLLDPVSGETELSPFGKLASWRSIQHSDSTRPCGDEVDGMGLPALTHPQMLSMIAFYGGDQECSFAFEGGRRFLADHRKGLGENGEYMLYLFIEPHEVGEPECGMSSCALQTDALLRIHGADLVYRHPLRFKNFCDGDDYTLHAPDPGRRFFIAVIDKLDVDADDVEEGYSAYDPGTCCGIASRRVVELNAKGYVVRDRLWDKEDLDGGPTTQSGAEETCVYDDDGRLIERRSMGWDSAENEDRETDGLIHVFEYFDEESNAPGELRAIGLKKGTGAGGAPSVVQYIAAFERDMAGRPDLITQEVRYPTPTSEPSPALQPSGSDMEMTEYQYTLAEGEYELVDGYTTAPIIEKRVITGAVPWSEDDITLYHGVDITQYDENGNLSWYGEGSVADPENMTGVQEFYVTYTGRDDLGRPDLIVEDMDLTAPFARGDLDELPDSLPEGWTRASPAGTAGLNLVTTHEYNAVYGLEHTVYPNGRELYISYHPHPENDELYQYVFDDVTFDGETGKFRLGKPAVVKKFRYGGLVEEKTFIPNDTDEWPDGVGAEVTDYRVLSVTTPSYDSSGRLVGMDRTGGDGSSGVSAAILYDGYGGIARQRDPDGTITRTVHDALGRVFKVFRGTQDQDVFWGYGGCLEGGDPSACPDNMVLIEKRYYGHGVHDFGQLIATRSYRDMPENQYFDVIPEACYGENPPDNCPPENNEDDIGWLTEIGYDWRMRPVWERSENEEGEALSHTFTWYDNLDRVRFVATYGSSAPSGSAIDPRLLGADCSIPDAAAILAVAPRPQSLSETCYNTRGQEAETLSYNVTYTSQPQATATRQYFNHRNAPIETHSANAPVQRNMYDYRGRLIRSSTYARVVGGDDIEITRTDTAFDSNNRAIHSTYWERRHDATDADLNDGNSVKTYTQSWYDKSGRIIASANFGTHNAGGTFETGGEPTSFGVVEPGGGGDPDQVDSDTPPVEFETPGDPASPVVGCMWDDTAVADALLTCYSYDEAGHQVAVFHPDRTISRTEYDDLDRVVLELENADDPDPEMIRRTAYQYDSETGQLVKMAAVLPNHQDGIDEYDDIDWDSYDGSLQVTEFEYVWSIGSYVFHAVVVDSDGNPISSNHSFISRVVFPQRSTGQPGGGWVYFEYYSDGSVARRTDNRGTIFTYSYDELGRRTEVNVDDYSPVGADPYVSPTGWYKPSSAEGQIAPPNRIHRITYEYDDDGRLYQVTAYSNAPDEADRVVSQNRYTYDLNGNLLADYQQHFDFVDAGSGDTHTYPPAMGTTPRTAYRWDYSPMEEYNFERLGGIQYPHETEFGLSPTLTLHYGNDADDVDSSLGRLTAIDHVRIGPNIAAYYYMGSRRRVGVVLGNGVSQTVLSGTVCSGLDQFGRLTDLHYVNAGGETLHRYQYGYDKAGNRKYARVTQVAHEGAAPEGVSHVNDRSYLYAYDGLHRLQWAGRGELDAGGEELLDERIPSMSAWQLDNLGNWSGGIAGIDGLIQTGDFDGDGVEDARYVHHEVYNDNQIDAVWEDGVETEYVWDRCGNLITDGVRYYQYDGWNRLVQVNLIGSVEIPPDSFSGRITDLHEGLGDLLCRYTYDGLGRLIRKETPVNEGSTYLQRKDLYYDGVRRIEEVIFRPTVTPEGEDVLGGAFVSEGAGGDGTGEDEGDAGGEVQNDELNLERADGSDPVQMIVEDIGGDGGDAGDSGEAGGGEIGPEGETYVDREYVYGPDYVDEFVLQIDRVEGLAIYMLQDANYNVMALTAGPNFPDGQGGILPLGSMLEQYVYEPYGAVAVSERFAPHAVNRVGHQGLFFERFGGSYVEETLEGNAGRGDAELGEGFGVGAEFGAAGLYYNRNRFYDPGLGRFIQRDPNETALPILTALAMNGEVADVLLGGFSGTGLYRDGVNLYQFARSNPVNGLDPLGTEFTLQGMGAAMGVQSFVGALVTGAITKALGGSFWHGFVGGAIAGAAGGAAGYAVSAFGASLSGLVGTLAMKGMIGGVDGFVGGFSQSYYDNHDLGIAVADGLLSGMLGAGTAGFLHGLGAWACFEGGTPVLTEGGLVPIESIALGDRVVSRTNLGAHETTRGYAQEDPLDEEWKLVTLTAAVEGGARCRMTLLRSVSWCRTVGATVGVTLSVDVSEIDLAEPACVLSIDPFPSGTIPSSGVPGLVTGVFVTTDTQVVDLVLEGYETPIGTTASHPFWSAERAGWVAAGELRVGEALRSYDGRPVIVSSVRLRSERATVYNLEVNRTHVFYVSEARILVHNSCPSYPRIINKKLAGKLHPVSRVPFDADGFPDFSSFAKKTVSIVQSGNRYADEVTANAKALYEQTPAGFTWHHHQNGTTMLLVPTDIHRQTAHTGGVALLGGG